MRLLVACALLGLSGVTFGQSDVSRRTSVFVELGGSGGLGSVNAEGLIKELDRSQFTWRAGLSLAPIDRNNGTGIVIPIMANALIGQSAHKLELGFGQGLTLTTKGSFFALTTLAAGYRYESRKTPLFYRVTYTPLVSYLVDVQVQHWGGVSVGYTFNSRKP